MKTLAKFLVSPGYIVISSCKTTVSSLRVYLAPPRKTQNDSINLPKCLAPDLAQCLWEGHSGRQRSLWISTITQTRQNARKQQTTLTQFTVGKFDKSQPSVTSFPALKSTISDRHGSGGSNQGNRNTVASVLYLWSVKPNIAHWLPCALCRVWNGDKCE